MEGLSQESLSFKGGCLGHHGMYRTIHDLSGMDGIVACLDPIEQGTHVLRREAVLGSDPLPLCKEFGSRRHSLLALACFYGGNGGSSGRG
jgi:hypothetical protein